MIAILLDLRYNNKSLVGRTILPSNTKDVLHSEIIEIKGCKVLFFQRVNRILMLLNKQKG